MWEPFPHPNAAAWAEKGKENERKIIQAVRPSLVKGLVEGRGGLTVPDPSRVTLWRYFLSPQTPGSSCTPIMWGWGPEPGIHGGIWFG